MPSHAPTVKACPGSLRLSSWPACRTRPALDFTWPHVDCRFALPADRNEARDSFWPDGVIHLDRAAVVEENLVEQKHALLGRCDFGDVVEIALNDDRAGHAA
jgi:hypothetical protein